VRIASRIDVVVPALPRCEDNQIVVCVKRLVGQWPFVEVSRVVGQVLAKQINRIVAWVIDFDPVGEVAVAVGQRVSVDRHQFRNEQRITGKYHPRFQRLGRQSAVPPPR
jgi:hypothetical protein